MIYEGFTLMIAGMVTVFIFLVLMILTIQLVSFLTRNITAAELKQIEDEKKARAAKRFAKKSKTMELPLPVIASAIAAYEEDSLSG